ncbi:hypothetical protein Efla_003865 [Eimeria flavescens]
MLCKVTALLVFGLTTISSAELSRNNTTTHVLAFCLRQAIPCRRQRCCSRVPSHVPSLSLSAKLANVVASKSDTRHDVSPGSRLSDLGGFQAKCLPLGSEPSSPGCTATNGQPVEDPTSCLFQRQPIQSPVTRMPLLCGLPRTVRASKMMMPSCARGEWAVLDEHPSAVDTWAAQVEDSELFGNEASAAPPRLKAVQESMEGPRNIDCKSEAAALARRLLERARLLQSAASGLFCVLPLGYRVMKKIEAICHEELEAVGAAPLTLPNLMPLEWLRTSHRLRAFGPTLYRLHDRRAREFFLPPTSEEAAAWLAATQVRSHRDLPLAFYQIAPKFRDEARPRAGCLRAREFVMLEAYSFHQDTACREAAYRLMDNCFRRILDRVGASSVHRVRADPGTMGGCCSHEYHVPSLLGEDTSPLQQPAFPSTGSSDAPSDDQEADVTRGSVSTIRSLEVGHCFQLPSTYCEAAKARVSDSVGALRVPLMNSYGLGISRLFGHLALGQQDGKGLLFPPHLAPFSVAILQQSAKRLSASRRVTRVAEGLFKRLEQIATEIGGSADILLDDRRGLTLRQMQGHADIVGIPHQILVKEELLKSSGPPRVLYIARTSGKAQRLPFKVALGTLRRELRCSFLGSQRVASFALN